MFMARILVPNISDLKVSVIPIERTVDSIGDLAIDERVSKMYNEKHYDLVPKSSEEAELRGQKNFNGLMSSFPRISVYHSDGSNIVSCDIAPTRYLMGEAMRDCIKQTPYSLNEINAMSPNMANVSVIAPFKKDGKYYLLSQIKGKALGSGQIHTGLVAGNVDAKYLYANNPLVEALRNECSEELGMDLSYLNSSSFVFLVDERETGQVNFASVASHVDFDAIMSSYESLTRRKLAQNQALEVMALSTLPIAGLAMTRLENGPGKEMQVTCYKPGSDGLVEVVENRGLRPYTYATIEFLSDSRNARFLLEKAGI
jgi:hypothetical protein